MDYYRSLFGRNSMPWWTRNSMPRASNSQYLDADSLSALKFNDTIQTFSQSMPWRPRWTWTRCLEVLAEIQWLDELDEIPWSLLEEQLNSLDSKITWGLEFDDGDAPSDSMDSKKFPGLDNQFNAQWTPWPRHSILWNSIDEIQWLISLSVTLAPRNSWWNSMDSMKFTGLDS